MKANTQEYRNYMREYMKRRYHERRTLAIEYLGGQCVKCGSKEKLEIDHIDRTSKEFKADQLRSQTIEIFWKEIKKCQLLCCTCHRYKTVEDIGNQHASDPYIQHGNTTTYRRGCRCNDCRSSCAKQMREYRAKKKLEKDLFK
jgi:hypothetical protein